ncbi:hypothetical protein ACFCVO_02280 [Agromyces sp. NPDC056379]|uniref:hypothetical protein n=1 Tax=unclassified Agromyces TaxID=2639701 RepID=UPI0035DE4349
MATTQVLEIRIHGIANAPPQDMLSTTADHVEKSIGDQNGSFWIRADGKQDDGTDAPHRIEAYSWGNQARSGGSALALIGRAIVHLSWLFVLPFGLTNLAYWTRRNIPGDDQRPPKEVAGEAARPAVAGTDGATAARPRWNAGIGAVWIRWFGLLQTLFYTAGFMSVSVDLVAVQCYRTGNPELVCAALPEWFDAFVGMTPIGRSALFSILPVIVMLLIYLIGLRVRGTFEPNRHEVGVEDTVLANSDEPKAHSARTATSKISRAGAATKSSPKTASAAPASAVHTEPPAKPLLGSRGFWRVARIGPTSERAHFAGALALVLLLLAFDAVVEVAPFTGVANPFDWPGYAVATAPIQAAAVFVAFVLIAGAFVLSALGGVDPEKPPILVVRGLALTLLVVSILSYALWVWLAIGTPEGSAGAGDREYASLTITPGVIATVCALIALWSLTWAYPRRRFWSGLVLILAFGSVLYGELIAVDDKVAHAALSYVAAGLAVLALLIGYAFHSKAERLERRFLGWHGNGAAVSMLLSLFSSMVITSLLVIGAHAWLSTSTVSAETDDRIWRILPDGTNQSLVAPDFYERFSVSLLFILVALLALAIVVASTAFSKVPRLLVPTLAFPTDTPSPRRTADENRGGIEDLAAGDPYPAIEGSLNDKERAVASARRLAGLAHRGEPILSALAILTAIALVPLTVPYFAELAKGAAETEQRMFWMSLTDVSAWALGFLAIAATTWVITNAVTSTERPLGLVWDIICFFPRAGHPFTPPCYAERTVPELEERIEDWFAGGAQGERAVLLSAHSMGAPIAVAVAFAVLSGGAPISDGGDDPKNVRAEVPTDRFAMLTYGVQLRAYFGRFFPAVFGPRVIGNEPTFEPSLVARDPWAAEIRREYGMSRPKRWWRPWSRADSDAGTLAAAAKPSETLVSVLCGASATKPHWRNLWRRTDYLGFPANRYRPGDAIDRGASERMPRTYLWSVARHNGYLGTLQYDAARSELLEVIAPVVDVGEAAPLDEGTPAPLTGPPMAPAANPPPAPDERSVRSQQRGNPPPSPAGFTSGGL